MSLSCLAFVPNSYILVNEDIYGEGLLMIKVEVIREGQNDQFDLITIDNAGIKHEYSPSLNEDAAYLVFDDGTILRASWNLDNEDNEYWTLKIEHQGRNTWRIEHLEDRGDGAFSDVATTDSPILWCVAGDYLVV